MADRRRPIAARPPSVTIARSGHCSRRSKAWANNRFYPPDVGGWPHGAVWLSTASAGIRFAVAIAMASRGDVSTVEHSAVGDRIDAAGYLIGIGRWSDRTVTALKPLTAHPPTLIAAAVNTPEYLTS